MSLFQVKIINNSAPKDWNEIHRLSKDSMYGLIQFINAISTKLGYEYKNLLSVEALDVVDFSIEELNQIDVSMFCIESFVLDSFTNDLSIFENLFNSGKKNGYDTIYVYTMNDNCSFLYIFINTEMLKLNVNIDDFLEGIKVGSSFEGGYLKYYTFNSELNTYISKIII